MTSLSTPIHISFTRHQNRKQTFQLDAKFSLPQNGICGLFGASGSGKTTLVRCLAGLEKPDQGLISFNGHPWFADSNQQNGPAFLPPHQRKIGVVFQDIRLFPHLSIRDNLLYGFKRLPETDRRIELDDVVGVLDLKKFLDKKPAQLSGGESQRVAIGRALLHSPTLLLMDEPLASLGIAHKSEILPYLSRLPKEFGIPILYVSHDIHEMAALADHMLVLEQGKIAASGPFQETALTLPDIHQRWSPTSVLNIESCQGNMVTLKDGQQVKLGPGNSGQFIKCAARDMTLVSSKPETHGAQAALEVSFLENITNGDGGLLARVSLADESLLVTMSPHYDDIPFQQGQSLWVLINQFEVTNHP